MNGRIYKDTPKRLNHLYQSYSNPLYFVTCNTWQRTPLLADKDVHESFREYAQRNVIQGRAIGRYVILPDHMHFFVRGGPDFKLGQFVRLMKQHISKVLQDTSGCDHIWQPGFFDHVLRHNESYAEKWAYVLQNPVRAQLVDRPEDWPYQGEIAQIDRV